MTLHADGNVEVYRVRLQELLGALLSQLSEQGNATAPMLAEGGAAFERLGRAKDIDELTRRFAEAGDRLLSHVEAPETESTTINHLERAKAYINEHLEGDLKVSLRANTASRGSDPPLSDSPRRKVEGCIDANAI